MASGCGAARDQVSRTPLTARKWCSRRSVTDVSGGSSKVVIPCSTAPPSGPERSPTMRISSAVQSSIPRTAENISAAGFWAPISKESANASTNRSKPAETKAGRIRTHRVHPQAALSDQHGDTRPERFTIHDAVTHRGRCPARQSRCRRDLPVVATKGFRLRLNRLRASPCDEVRPVPSPGQSVRRPRFPASRIPRRENSCFDGVLQCALSRERGQQRKPVPVGQR